MPPRATRLLCAALVCAACAPADAVLVTAASPTSITLAFHSRGTLLYSLALRGELGPALRCGAAMSVAVNSSTLMLHGLPAGAILLLTTSEVEGAANASTALVALPSVALERDADEEVCWTCVLSALSVYGQLLHTRSAPAAPDQGAASARLASADGCVCWRCNTTCEPAEESICSGAALPAAVPATPPLQSPSPPTPLMPPIGISALDGPSSAEPPPAPWWEQTQGLAAPQPPVDAVRLAALEWMAALAGGEWQETLPPESASASPAPLTVLSSILRDALSRVGDSPVVAGKASEVALATALTASLFNLWQSPIYGPYLLQAWAKSEGSIWPNAAGAG